MALVPKYHHAHILPTRSPVLVARRVLRWSGAVSTQYRSIVVVDITGFGRWDDRLQLHARAILRTAMRAGCRHAGIRWSRLAVEDRGDGMIILVPADVPRVDILRQLVPAVSSLMSRHNATVPAGRRIRLRIAVHCGEVHRDATGWVGVDLNFACRLVDAPALYGRLRESGHVSVAVAVSEAIHRAVTHAAGVFTPVQLTVKEVDSRIWVCHPTQ